MGIGRFVGRALLAPVFLYGGWDVLSHPEPRVRVAQQAGAPEPEVAVRVNAAVMVGAGALLLLGIAPRLAAGVLVMSLIPTTLAGHQCWTKQGPEQKQQLTHFFKNLAAIGGLLLVVTDSEEGDGR